MFGSESFKTHFFVVKKKNCMKIREILELTVPGLGYELVDIDITPAKMVVVYIDKEGGISIDDCETVSKHLNNLFFVEEIDYNRLEVSSPGIERPLKKLESFIKFQGKLAKIKTHELIDGQKVFQGHIKEVNGKKIILSLENEEICEIDFDNVNRARLVFEENKNKKKLNVRKVK